MRFPRITVDAQQMGGVPCIRGLRIPVATVVGLIAQGVPEGQILAEYPDLEPEDLREALRFAAAAVDERELPVRTVSLEVPGRQRALAAPRRGSAGRRT